MAFISKGSKLRKMGWFSPDLQNPEAHIKANNFHTISALYYHLDASGNLIKRDSIAHGSYFYTAARALVIRKNCTVALVNLNAAEALYAHAMTGDPASGQPVFRH